MYLLNLIKFKSTFLICVRDGDLTDWNQKSISLVNNSDSVTVWKSSTLSFTLINSFVFYVF